MTDLINDESAVPGRSGPSATVEIDPARIGPVRTAYAPAHDGDPDPGEIVWSRDTTFSWDGRLVHMHEDFFLVRVDEHDARPEVDLAAENVVEVAWWTPAELAAPRERLAPLNLPELVRTLTA